MIGTVLSAPGLGLLVFGVLRSSEWGWIQPKAGGAVVGRPFADRVADPGRDLRDLGLLPLGGAPRLHGEEPLVRPGMLRNRQLSGGLIMFFFQYLVQAGFFFVVPLFLSVCLGLSALATGARLLPLSVTLLLAAIGIPTLPSRTSHPGSSSGSVSSRCSPGRSSCSAPWTQMQAQRSSSCRCS